MTAESEWAIEQSSQSLPKSMKKQSSTESENSNCLIETQSLQNAEIDSDSEGELVIDTDVSDSENLKSASPTKNFYRWLKSPTLKIRQFSNQSEPAKSMQPTKHDSENSKSASCTKLVTVKNADKTKKAVSNKHSTLNRGTNEAHKTASLPMTYEILRNPNTVRIVATEQSVSSKMTQNTQIPNNHSTNPVENSNKTRKGQYSSLLTKRTEFSRQQRGAAMNSQLKTKLLAENNR